MRRRRVGAEGQAVVMFEMGPGWYRAGGCLRLGAWVCLVIPRFGRGRFQCAICAWRGRGNHHKHRTRSHTPGSPVPLLPSTSRLHISNHRQILISRCQSQPGSRLASRRSNASRHAGLACLGTLAADEPSLAIRALQAERDEWAPTQATQDSTNERIRLARN